MAMKSSEKTQTDQAEAHIPEGCALAYLELRRGGYLVLDRLAWLQKKRLVWRVYPADKTHERRPVGTPWLVPFQSVKAQPKHHGSPMFAAVGTPVVCLHPEAMIHVQGHSAWPMLGFLGEHLGQSQIWMYCRDKLGDMIKINVPVSSLRAVCDVAVILPVAVSKIETTRWFLYA